MVDDQDLAERLPRGAIPVEDAIAIAKQIAEGLEEAHEHGIIHRDLKPANVNIMGTAAYTPGRDPVPPGWEPLTSRATHIILLWNGPFPQRA